MPTRSLAVTRTVSLRPGCYRSLSSGISARGEGALLVDGDSAREARPAMVRFLNERRARVFRGRL